MSMFVLIVILFSLLLIIIISNCVTIIISKVNLDLNNIFMVQRFPLEQWM